MGIRILQEERFEVPDFILPINFSGTDDERRQAAFRLMPKTSEALAAEHILTSGTIDPLSRAPIQDIDSPGNFNLSVAEFSSPDVGTIEEREFLYRTLFDATSGFRNIVSVGNAEEAKGMMRAAKAMRREGKFYTADDLSLIDLEALEEGRVSVIKLASVAEAQRAFIDSKSRDRGETDLHLHPGRDEYMDTGRSTAMVEVATELGGINCFFVPRSLGGKCMACIRVAMEVYGPNVRIDSFTNPSKPSEQQVAQQMMDFRQATGRLIGPNSARTLAGVRVAAHSLSGNVVAILSGSQISEQAFDETIKAAA